MNVRKLHTSSYHHSNLKYNHQNIYDVLEGDFFTDDQWLHTSYELSIGKCGAKYHTDVCVVGRRLSLETYN